MRAVEIADRVVEAALVEVRVEGTGNVGVRVGVGVAREQQDLLCSGDPGQQVRRLLGHEASGLGAAGHGCPDPSRARVVAIDERHRDAELRDLGQELDRPRLDGRVRDQAVGALSRLGLIEHLLEHLVIATDGKGTRIERYAAVARLGFVTLDSPPQVGKVETALLL